MSSTVAADNNDNKWTAAEVYVVLRAKLALEAFDMEGFQKIMTPAINSKIMRLGYPESEIKHGIRGIAESTTASNVTTKFYPRSIFRPKYR